jgi:hypothetical protein
MASGEFAEIASRQKALQVARRVEWSLAACVLTVVVGIALIWLLGLKLLFGAVLRSTTNWALLTVSLVLVLTTLIGALALTRRVVPLLFERAQLRSIIRGNDALSSMTPYELAAVSGAAVFVPLCLVGPFTVICIAVTHGDKSPVLALFSFLGITCLLYAFAYHRVPNSRRSVKYGAFLTGSALFGSVLSVGDAKRGGDPYFYAVLMFFMALVISFWMRIWLRPGQPLVAGEASTNRARRWRRRSMTYGPQPGAAQLVWLIIKAIPLFGDFMWAGRIWSKQRLAQAPVLFLRSFSHQDSALLLGKIVSPAISRVSVVAALVHPSQTAAALNAKTHDAWTPMTFGVANEVWQNWYLKRLTTAVAVVVDAGILSDATRWELEQALRVLGPHRVAVLTSKDSTLSLPGGTVFVYDVARPFHTMCVLSRWIDDVMDAMYGSAAHVARPSTRANAA